MIGPANPYLSGILLALGGGVALSLNDLSIKFLSDDYALHQIILLRALITLPIIFAVISISRTGYRQLRSRRLPEHFLRVCIVLISNVTYFLGLALMPLAEAVAIAFIAPVLVTVMSAAVLHETVGLHRWAAVGVGLLGVVVMVRPDAGALQPAAILVLISAATYAGSHIMTRRMRDTESAITLNFHVQIGFVILSGAIGLWAGDGHLAEATQGGTFEFLFRPWVIPAASDWPAFLATGLAVGIGGLMMSQAYRSSEAALIAPFEYIGMPMAVFWGVVVFGTWPDGRAWIGMTLICGAGLYTLLRETLRRRDVDVAAPTGEV
jgi:drug/metabolite transporter (DMT)-like permease